MHLVKFTLLSVGFIALTGCANLKETNAPTAEALQDKTAGVLGYPSSSVKVTEIREGSSVTYFVATTPKGTYGCTIPSGGFAAYATLGMVQFQPTCNKQ